MLYCCCLYLRTCLVWWRCLIGLLLVKIVWLVETLQRVALLQHPQPQKRTHLTSISVILFIKPRLIFNKQTQVPTFRAFILIGFWSIWCGVCWSLGSWFYIQYSMFGPDFWQNGGIRMTKPNANFIVFQRIRQLFYERVAIRYRKRVAWLVCIIGPLGV